MVYVDSVFKTCMNAKKTQYYVKPCTHVCLQVSPFNTNDLLAEDYNAQKLPAGKHTMKGL